MKIVQDKLRNRQALLVSGLITLVFTSLFLFIIYEQRIATTSEGINRLQARMLDIFNDNELIADAIGERYHHIKNDDQCGDISQFTPRNKDEWGINADPKRVHSATGTIITQQTSRGALCMYAAAEFIRGMVNELNPGSFDAHRYIIAKNSDYFYWFMASDSRHFSFSSSDMARDITNFFYPPVDFYTRLLQKNVKNKALSSTNFYTDKITGEKAYSVVSYIYDLSGKEISDQIVAYLVYDHSKPELQEALANAFDYQMPQSLNVALVNLTNNESLCLSGKCVDKTRLMVRKLSDKYALHYSLSLGRFMARDTQAGIVILLAPFFFIMISFSLKSWLNESDLKVYIDTLTGCFNRRILDIIKRRDLSHCSVVLLDCNKFKTVNDTWGHAAGDRALQIIANRMLSNTRTSHDIVIRTGGDEFMILLFRSQASDATAIAQVNGELDVAIQNADNAMYKMKHKKEG
ncbi:GGDEF domain-containing protein [Citrobacter sp. EC_71]|uniref:GGDEF domain-containing protein n=1 Tax=Citrobacter sp. EC_71 TaxID=2584093 RepID=UPI001C6FE47F|nr:GGDEF domain-containing protein [Citrobacter sp. EC_71]MBW9351211.1 GGDEF domain-containing protein [Citrobacter sp. EC_71]